MEKSNHETNLLYSCLVMQWYLFYIVDWNETTDGAATGSVRFSLVPRSLFASAHLP